MDEGINILIAGMGGQGVMLASKALAQAAAGRFSFVSRTESRGLSQRGGSVESEVRFANRALSTSIGEGQADLVLSLDLLEAFRHLHRIKTSGTVVANRSTVIPIYMLRKKDAGSTEAGSKAELESRLSQISMDTRNAVVLELSELSNRLNYAKGVNVALLGAASPLLPIDSAGLLREILSLLPEQIREKAIETFRAGREAALRQVETAAAPTIRSVA